jgi:hypothetical protein
LICGNSINLSQYKKLFSYFPLLYQNKSTNSRPLSVLIGLFVTFMGRLFYKVFKVKE